MKNYEWETRCSKLNDAGLSIFDMYFNLLLKRKYLVLYVDNFDRR